MDASSNARPPIANGLSSDPDANPLRKKIPFLLKVYAVLLLVSAVGAAVITTAFIVRILMNPEGYSSSFGSMSLVFAGIIVLLTLATAICEIIFAVRLLKDKRRHARHMCETIIILVAATMLCNMMISGIADKDNIAHFLNLILLTALMVYLDPSLSEERALKRKLRDMETRERAEEGTLGRDETGKGFIELDFFNLFWIFTVCSVLGLIIETVYHFVVFGGYQDRAGMLYGPFSPIYGFGGTLMTIALNRFHDKPIPVIFLVSAIIGGAFEYFVSWFMQFAFGIVAWDYTGTFLSIDGRTNFMFMCMWGALGCFWVKLCLPRLLKVVNIIPWNWRYSVTTVCAALMIVNGFLTLASLDCWYQREAGIAPSNALEQFCAKHYDNDFMANRFQSMSIDPSNSTRTDS